MSIEELIAALEKATGPDRDCDAGIHAAINGHEIKRFSRSFAGDAYYWRNGPHEIAEPFCNIPEYSASIDAALTLVPEGGEWECGSAKLVADGRWHWAKIITSSAEFIGKGPTTPAIALCIASLRARHATAPVSRLQEEMK